MGRERWFFAQNAQRRGPVPLAQLVESVLAQPDPRGVLVWRKGFAEWTRAEDVPEVERKIAPFLARKEEAEAAARRAAAPAPTAPAAATTPAPPPEAGSNALVYGGIAAGIVALALLGWIFWPRPQPAPQVVPLPLGGTSAENAPAVLIPAPQGGGAPAATATAPPASVPQAGARLPPASAASASSTPPPAGIADRESELPPSELRKLKGVAAWSGETLRYTLYNGTQWRITELYLRVGRFRDDDFQEDPKPLQMLPPGGQVEAGVADLLSRVAPDRKKPGLNPLDTGPFEAVAGPQPESFRAEIESARGYPPR